MHLAKWHLLVYHTYAYIHIVSSTYVHVSLSIRLYAFCLWRNSLPACRPPPAASLWAVWAFALLQIFHISVVVKNFVKFVGKCRYIHMYLKKVSMLFTHLHTHIFSEITPSHATWQQLIHFFACKILNWRCN